MVGALRSSRCTTNDTSTRIGIALFLAFNYLLGLFVPFPFRLLSCVTFLAWVLRSCMGYPYPNIFPFFCRLCWRRVTLSTFRTITILGADFWAGRISRPFHASLPSLPSHRGDNCDNCCDWEHLSPRWSIARSDCDYTHAQVTQVTVFEFCLPVGYVFFDVFNQNANPQTLRITSPVLEARSTCISFWYASYGSGSTTSLSVQRLLPAGDETSGEEVNNGWSLSDHAVFQIITLIINGLN